MMGHDKQLTSLEDPQWSELSLVKRGANKKKRFPITKGEETMVTLEEILKAVLEGEIESEEKLEEIFKAAKVSDKGVAAAKGALRLLEAFKDELPAGIMAKLAKVAGMKAEDEEDEKPGFMFPDKAKKAEVDEWLEAMPEELRKQFTPIEDEPEDQDMDTKNLPEEVQAILKAREDELEELKKTNEQIAKDLSDAKDERELASWMAKAEKECSHFPGKSVEEMAKMLKSLNDVNPGMAQAQFESMKAASDALKTSTLLKESGAGGGSVGGGDAWSQIEKLAEGLVEKSDDLDLTKEKAVNRVLESDRGQALYKQYLEENPQQAN